MKLLLAFYLVCLLLPGSSMAGQQDAGVLLRRAPVPAKPPHQGEVRLVRRDSALVLQTVLYSKVLRHVVMAIRRKELNEWPEGRDGWLDSRRYSDELFRAYETVRERDRNRTAEDSRYLPLLIEFTLEQNRSYVRLYQPSLEQAGETFSLQDKTLLLELRVSRDYAYNNMLAIIRDSFQLEPQDAVELLQPVPGEP